MCILCVLSRWSRRIVTMLPWLVIPFIITWAFSQLLPPGYRLEVTSTRLACLGVLLSSLGWYELLMPWLSSWRARRSALLRERRLIEAQEAAKWRKEATRRCRNCLTAYKIQSPGGGRFVCTYCGHVSKRPVLEVPTSFAHMEGQGLQKASYASMHSGGQLVNGTGLRSATRHDSGCWSRSSERRGCLFGDGTCGIENCKAWQPLMRALSYVGDLFSLIAKLRRKMFAGEKDHAESSRNAQKLKDDLVSSLESRSEKARKRANEKRQARLQRERLEAEEKKQREDVARLVEERRRQREEKLRIEQESEREAAAERDREMRRVRELERRRKDKAKERTWDEVETKPERVCAVDSSTKSKEEVETVAPVKLAEKFRPVQGARVKGNVTRSDLPKDAWTVKRKLIPPFKMGSIFQRNSSWNSKTDALCHESKVGNLEPAVFPSSSRTVPKADAGKAPWFNAWLKGSELLKEGGLKEHTGSSTCHWEKPVQNSNEARNIFNNKAVGAKQLQSSVGVTAIQPPIAPPTSQTGSLHQLFCSPTIFPPLDLPVEFPNHREHISQVEVQAFLPEHTFFETPACVARQSCKSISRLSVPLSPATSFSVQDSLSSPQQPKLNAIDANLMCTDAPQQTTAIGVSPPAELTTTPEVSSNSVCPRSLSISDSITFKTENLSPSTVSLEVDELYLKSDKHDTLHWKVPSIFLDNTDIEEQIWNTWQFQNGKVDESFDSTQYTEHEALQLPHLSTVQSLFDSAMLLPESLSLSPQKERNLYLNSDDIARATQVVDRKGLWSDISAFNAAIQIWDDADNHQKVPPEFVDCITQEIMRDPVITADGHSYERSAIEKWLKDHDTSPKTGEVLPPPPGGVGVDKTLRPNHILRGQIIEYKEKLAKMQARAVSWSSMSKNGDILTMPNTVGPLWG